MVENEQLGKELGYHIRQTELLLQKNEKLVEENIDLHRKVLLAKEVQDDLAHRNRMNQKTIRILLYKLRERHHALKSGKHVDDQELKGLLCRQEQPQTAEKMKFNQVDGFTQETARDVKSGGGAEEAMKFLYACFEDIETDQIDKIISCQLNSKSGTHSRPDLERKPCLQSSLDGLNSQERQEVLMHLLRTAVSLRAVTQNAEISGHFEGPLHSLCLSNEAKAAVSVDDILRLPLETVCVNGAVINKHQSNTNFVSSSVQTEGMDLEERIALEVKARLRTCGSSGAEA